MRSAALTLALLLTPLLQAQQSETTRQAPCTIEGVVLKSTTGQPLKRALITTQRMGASDSQHTARTDPGGRFVLKDLDPGEYNLWVNRDGYLGMGYGQEVPNGPGKLLKLAPGQQKKDLVFRLVPTGAVIGRVYDEDGEPISGVNEVDRKSTRLNSSHDQISYAVFCLKKKTNNNVHLPRLAANAILTVYPCNHLTTTDALISITLSNPIHSMCPGDSGALTVNTIHIDS